MEAAELDTPVNRMTLRLGMSTSIALRLFSRAPRTSMQPGGWEPTEPMPAKLGDGRRSSMFVIGVQVEELWRRVSRPSGHRDEGCAPGDGGDGPGGVEA